MAKSVFESNRTTAIAKAKSTTVVIMRANTTTPVFSVNEVVDMLDLDDTRSHNGVNAYD